MRWVAPPMPMSWCQCYWTIDIERINIICIMPYMAFCQLIDSRTVNKWRRLVRQPYEHRHPGANVLSIGKRRSDYVILVALMKSEQF